MRNPRGLTVAMLDHQPSMLVKTQDRSSNSRTCNHKCARLVVACVQLLGDRLLMFLDCRGQEFGPQLAKPGWTDQQPPSAGGCLQCLDDLVMLCLLRHLRVQIWQPACM